jgi:GH43 family beta-xylosidase
MLKTKQKLPTLNEMHIRGGSVINTVRHKKWNSPLIASGQDPWVLRFKGSYYYCTSVKNNSALIIEKAHKLKELSGAKVLRVWKPHQGIYSKQIWAPELHHIGRKWYIYFAAEHKRNNSHRMYVLESEGNSPAGPYHFKSQITSKDNHWAIDGTILKHKGKPYFIWSGWEGRQNGEQRLYIAPMSNPWTISGERICISRPEYQWEGWINEGPEVLSHRGKIFIIYSANASFGDDYCLGQLELKGEDPLNPLAWKKKAHPVFHKNKNIFAPGHASFVKNGKRDWIIYHTAKFHNAGWNREVHTKPFTWNRDNSPHFGSII